MTSITRIEPIQRYHSTHHIRCVTAAALFDGHDASINIIRRLLQSSGAEVIHLGHNRSVRDVVEAALQEDVQAIAISSYQGGHMEYFRYLRELLNERGGRHIQVFGGGGGVIVPDEIAELERDGIARIFSPEHGRQMGLQGMINSMLESADFNTCPELNGHLQHLNDFHRLARAITFVENHGHTNNIGLPALDTTQRSTPIIGITGPGGAGKSSLTDELCLRFLEENPDMRLAILAVDPTRRKTGGALLGDRIRMNAPALFPDRIFMRSLATRDTGRSVSAAAQPILQLLQAAQFDLIILETSGTGQSDAEIVDLVDTGVYVMTAEFGAPTQLEKIAMLDYADLVALNKAEKQGAQDALAYVRKQYQRNHEAFDRSPESMPVYATIASRFNDPGVNHFYNQLLKALETRRPDLDGRFRPIDADRRMASGNMDMEIIPSDRRRYLAEIADTLDKYHIEAEKQAGLARDLQALERSIALLSGPSQNEKNSDMNTDNVAEDNIETSSETQGEVAGEVDRLRRLADSIQSRIKPEVLQFIQKWPRTREAYRQEEFRFQVRDREIVQQLKYHSLSGLGIPVIALPAYESAYELVRYFYKENLPGSFPYTAAVFPFRKQGEDPTRMFAGEGGPERTNIRFHYLTHTESTAEDAAHTDESTTSTDQGTAAAEQSAHTKTAPSVARLSTAFDSVTLYGEDPARRPDIYGKVGNSGVSVPTLDDCKKLYSGFDLLSPGTSVSMTINGPAPMLLAFFFNTVIDQQIERHLAAIGELETARQKIAAFYQAKDLPVPTYRRDLPTGHNGLGLQLLGMSGSRLVEPETYERIKADALHRVRGTVQADILKEDQAQNTCIFSTAFALRMMGDIQEYFVQNQVRNFYSVSISGYHIAEAGANPITQLAFTLANGFTYVEYYLKRGLPIDSFAPNFSFFFSNGLDAEYSVIGRVARRIWAVAMRRLYGANDRSQKLKYHIQTSGRSLHAREIDFNDIRTTLQALYALYDNCNSLHTNAYDEAITTPTEESVRRAMAIQMIINKELGQNKNQNPSQGAFIIDELTELVEQAVLAEFRRLTERGGVPAAMETMYQRARIQEESLHYEALKHSGELPIVGVNTYLNPNARESMVTELIRSSDEEKDRQIESVQLMQRAYAQESDRTLDQLKSTALQGANTFEALMDAARVCSLGQISNTLYKVGGSYRRNM